MWFCATLAGMKKLIMNYFGVLHASIWWLRLDPTAETEPAKLSKLLEPPGNQQYALWGLLSKTHQKYSGSFSCESIFPCQLSDGMHSFGSWMIEPDPPTTTETIRNHQKPSETTNLHASPSRFHGTSYVPCNRTSLIPPFSSMACHGNPWPPAVAAPDISTSIALRCNARAKPARIPMQLINTCHGNPRNPIPFCENPRNPNRIAEIDVDPPKKIWNGA